jgi:D-alanyl-D-alanine carboxypeptidase
MSVWQRVVAALLVLAAVVAVVVAFTDDNSRSASAAPNVAATPIWSARRVPQPIVDAVGAQRLQHVLDENFGGNGTCFVVDGSGAQLASHNPDAPLMGASTQKIFIAVAMLATLGPDFAYETKVVAPAAPADGSVERLWMVGSGDPVLATNEYRDFLRTEGETRDDVTRASSRSPTPSSPRASSGFPVESSPTTRATTTSGTSPAGKTATGPTAKSARSVRSR